MVELTLPKNSRMVPGRTWPKPVGHDGKDVGKLTEFRIYRWNPEEGGQPRIDTYFVDRADCGPMILDGIIWIKSKIDPTLTFRRSCREGICGSCSMNIDGTNTLACTKGMDEVDGIIKIYPLAAYAGDQGSGAGSHALLRAARFDRALASDDDAGAGEGMEAVTRRSRERSTGLYECILCACCSTACPSYWWNSHKFLGPAVLLQAYRWLIDSRDEHKGERLDNLEDPFRLYRCHTIMNCANSCPKGLNPAKAIAEIRKMMVVRQI